MIKETRLEQNYKDYSGNVIGTDEDLRYVIYNFGQQLGIWSFGDITNGGKRKIENAVYECKAIFFYLEDPTGILRLSEDVNYCLDAYPELENAPRL